MIIKDVQKEEALKRMAKLQLHKDCVKAFKEDNTVWMSEDIGYLYTLNDEQMKLVQDWEKETNNLAYHVIHNLTNFGELLTILYVSQYTEEWEMDRADIENSVYPVTPLTYVMNLTDEFCSEYGRVGVRSSIGGLVRVS